MDVENDNDSSVNESENENEKSTSTSTSTSMDDNEKDDMNTSIDEEISDDNDYDNDSISVSIRNSNDDDEYDDEYEYDDKEENEDDGDENEIEEEEEEEEKDMLDVGQIIACYEDTIANWSIRCQTMNTSEIHLGSRWQQQQQPKQKQKQHQQHQQTKEKRFLIKWFDLSYLHCSWETEHDLIHSQQTDQNTKIKIDAFMRHEKNNGTSGYDEYHNLNVDLNVHDNNDDGINDDNNNNNNDDDSNNDNNRAKAKAAAVTGAGAGGGGRNGEFFDPEYTQIERVLGVKDLEEVVDPNISSLKSSASTSTSTSTTTTSTSTSTIPSHDKEYNPDFKYGLGKQLLIKWKNIPYSEVTYEYEIDLLLSNISYLPHLNKFHQRNSKPTLHSIRTDAAIKKRKIRDLYHTFGDVILINTNTTNTIINTTNINTVDTTDTNTTTTATTTATSTNDNNNNNNQLITMAHKKEEKINTQRKKLKEYKFPNNGSLRDYQIEGVLWLLSNYINNRSSILADEMGLGKTIQTAVFLHILSNEYRVNTKPYMIVVPLSTVYHWQREIESWTNLNTVVYTGKAVDRDVTRQLEFAYECDRPSSINHFQSFLKCCHERSRNRSSGSSSSASSSSGSSDRHRKRSSKEEEKIWMIQVLIISPDLLTQKDSLELMNIEWEMLIVDEAHHRLKNPNGTFASWLKDDKFIYNHSLLITGTPIQNRISELWIMMNIIAPTKFDDYTTFMHQYSNLKDKDNVDKLHKAIQPYILRRLKNIVERLPPKEEIIIEVELSVLQKKYYRALHERNHAFLFKNKGQCSHGPSLNAMMVQLRKCCNHPFLLKGVEDQATKGVGFQSDLEEIDLLVQSSGKLVFLDKMLPKLKREGHRVLLFSQFTKTLDIIEDYMLLRCYTYERIDGRIRGKDRQMAIDRFQMKDKSNDNDPPFVMLLSTRAGGVGINLVAADVCIMFDSDWNPQNDLQAQARCHRIGQTKSVKVYRLLTRKTCEFYMFNVISLKIGLDRAILKSVETNDIDVMTSDEVEQILRYGAYDFFNEDTNGTSMRISMDFFKEDIETILRTRSKKVLERSSDEVIDSTFSQVNFTPIKGAKETCKGMVSSNIDIDDPDFWKKILSPGEQSLSYKNTPIKTSSQPKQRERRQRINYNEQLDFGNILGKDVDEDQVET